MELRQLSQNKSVKGDLLGMLPFIEQRKQSLSFEEQHQFLRNKVVPTEAEPQRPVDSDQSQLYRSIKNNICFLFPKDGKKGRIPLTPKKIEVRER